MRRKINVQLISISIIAIISTMLVMLFVFYDLFQTQVQDDLSANAIVLKNTGIFHSGNEKAIHMDYRELRVTWISSDGTVLYDNDADVGTMDNHMSRPEVKNAFKRGDGSAVRQSATMGTNTFYYAIKLNDGSVLRVAREASNIWTVGGKIFPIIAATILVMMILCIILAHFMTKNLVKPIEQMAVDINDFSITPAYKELAPFAATIRAQHADILKSARMRQDFTANVSHELKTPLTAISGYAELMENGMVPPEEIGSFAQKIEKNARRLLSLINDIIRLSELDSSNTQLLVEKFDLFEEAQICVENMQIYAEKNDVTITYEGGHQEITANREMINELINNLCANAIRYNKKNGSVKVRVDSSQGHPYISVADTGIGISKEHQKRVFERFYRVDKSRSKQTGGTGLGLAIVKLMRFYDVNKGKIMVEGTDIRDITRESLRTSYGMVLQDTWLRSGTIRDNITMGREGFSDEQIIAAAKEAHSYSFIKKMPKGLDTYITEDGAGMSQGQKQLLCITRVMLDLPSMLILDEATSSIDTRTEQKIQNAFAKMMAGRTSFIVAHRLSTIQNADVILVMRDGHIIEQGNHETLLKQNGFYAKLYNSQFAS